MKVILIGFTTWTLNAFGAAGDTDLKPTQVLPCLGASDRREKVVLSTRMGGSKVGSPRRWWECHTGHVGWVKGRETQSDTSSKDLEMPGLRPLQDNDSDG